MAKIAPSGKLQVPSSRLKAQKHLILLIVILSEAAAAAESKDHFLHLSS